MLAERGGINDRDVSIDTGRMRRFRRRDGCRQSGRAMADNDERGSITWHVTIDARIESGPPSYPAGIVRRSGLRARRRGKARPIIANATVNNCSTIAEKRHVHRVCDTLPGRIRGSAHIDPPVDPLDDWTTRTGHARIGARRLPQRATQIALLFAGPGADATRSYGETYRMQWLRLFSTVGGWDASTRCVSRGRRRGRPDPANPNYCVVRRRQHHGYLFRDPCDQDRPKG